MSREVWPEVVLMEELHPKSHTSDMAIMQEKTGSGLQRNGSRPSVNMKPVAVAEGQLESGAIWWSVQATVKHGGGSWWTLGLHSTYQPSKTVCRCSEKN